MKLRPVFSLRAGWGTTLGTTPKASGTSPPAVTISGALAQNIGLQIETTAGARGVATFKWSINNGASYVATGVLTAATVDIATPGGTITIAFPNATYAANNIYKGTVATSKDQSGNGHHAIATVQPVLLVADAAYNGQPTLDCTAGQYLVTSSFVVAQPFTAYWSGEVSADHGDYRTAWADLASLSGPALVAVAGDPGALYQQAPTVLSSGVSGGGKMIVASVFDGVRSSIGVKSATPNASDACGPASLGGLVIGAYQNLGFPGTGKFARLDVYPGAHTALQRLYLMRRAAIRYGVALS